MEVIGVLLQEEGILVVLVLIPPLSSEKEKPANPERFIDPFSLPDEQY